MLKMASDNGTPPTALRVTSVSKRRRGKVFCAFSRWRQSSGNQHSVNVTLIGIVIVISYSCYHADWAGVSKQHLFTWASAGGEMSATEVEAVRNLGFTVKIVEGLISFYSDAVYLYPLMAGSCPHADKNCEQKLCATIIFLEGGRTVGNPASIRGGTFCFASSPRDVGDLRLS